MIVSQRRIELMDRLRMRTTLLIPLLLLSFGCTIVSLLVISKIVQQQVRANLSSDLHHSVQTYQNLEHQRRELLSRESSLLADLPSLKALMTARDTRTIEDAGVEFWKVSGSDLFALLDANGKLITAYNRGYALDRYMVERGLEVCLRKPEEPMLLALDGRLYEISTQPLFFGDRASGSQLGFVAVGYAVDGQVAREVSEAAEAEVAFAVEGKIVASTLNSAIQQQLMAQASELLQSPGENKTIRLGTEDYLVASVHLTMPGKENDATGRPQLIVLKSFEQATQLLHRVNRWVSALGLFAFLAGTGMLIAISRTLTRPLETLVGGTRALAQGNFEYQLSENGAAEIRELSRAFERMRFELRRSQKELLNSERLATIGRMASSISHDLRHYLSAMYANAEFMNDGTIAQSERDELLLEVRSAVQGMTDLLDSLLLFTQTGRALYPEYESIAVLIERSVSLVRSHPETRDVKITLKGLSSLSAWVDAKKLGRAVYNLLLNACQAAKRGRGPASVTLSLHEDERFIHIHIADNGPGVPESIRQTMFLPFVSEGKESGIGLGLTLAQQIAQEHGGSINLEETVEEGTIFTITLSKTALQALGTAIEKKSLQPRTPVHQ
jgi:signal transduction histidine kinase